MTLAEFRATLSAGAPPPDLPPLLRALWHDAKGDWSAAHHVAQDVESSDGSWVHAYLHRKEGDAGNAAYWYRRAGKPVTGDSPDEEWEQIAEELLARGRLFSILPIRVVPNCLQPRADLRFLL
jgi:hypothetical protein